MKRYNPNYETRIFRNISNTIEWIFNQIMILEGEDPFDLKWTWMKFELSKDKSYDDVIEKIINIFLKANKKINHNISKEVLDHISETEIIPILESNLEYESIIISKKTIDRIIEVCHYVFIEEFHNYDNLEVTEENYILIKYRYVEFCLNEIISSVIKKKEIESWLEQEMGIIWKNNFQKIWINLTEKQISIYEFIKKAFKIIGEIKFINILNRNPLIDKCRRSNAKKFEY